MRSNNQFVNSGNNRVFSYLRWSSERQTWGDSERRQNEMAEAWCARLGLNLSGCEKDEGVSAFKGKNHGQGTGLDRLLKIVGPGDTILVEDNDRFSRQDTVTALSALRDIVSRGVKLVFLKTGVEVTAANFNDPSVLFPNFFQGYLANAESAKKAARVKASWEARKAAMVKEGKPMNQNLPSWLRWNWETKEVVQIPERVQIVRRIFKLYLDNGSIKKVTRQLVSEGIPSISKRKSAGWSNSFIHHLLTNRSVLGYSLHTNPPTPNIFPKIVAEKDFYAVGGRLKVARNFCAAARKADANLFTGIALCSKCGRPMNKNTYRRKETQRSYLICGAALHDTSNCGTSGIRYDVFENSFLGLLTQDETVRAVLTGKTAEPGKVDSLKAELADVQGQCEKYMRLIDGDDKPSRRISDALKALEARESELQDQIELEIAKSKATAPPAQAYEALRQEFPIPTIRIDNRSRLKELIRSMVERIEVKVSEPGYSIHFKNGQAYGVKLLSRPVPAERI